MPARAAAPLDVAIVGCGAVVDRLYRPALHALERTGVVRVVALVDPDTRRAAAMARGFRGARVSPSLAESPTATLTLVASPPVLHPEHALAAIERGSHVLCEKPMALTPADGAAMHAAARTAGCVLAVGMTRRVYPCVVDARALIAAGALGDDLRFVHREGLRYDWPASTASAFRRATAGGGVLVDTGSHALDLLSLLLGPLSVVAYADDGDHDGVETNCRVELAGERAHGVMQLSWTEPLVTGLHVIGSAGELLLDPRVVDELRWRRRDREWVRVTCARPPASRASRTSASRIGWPTRRRSRRSSARSRGATSS